MLEKKLEPEDSALFKKVQEASDLILGLAHQGFIDNSKLCKVYELYQDLRKHRTDCPHYPAIEAAADSLHGLAEHFLKKDLNHPDIIACEVLK
ncbi:MAG: hypothetical protein V1837_03820 [Candidatus Woesearchaeota archaeon]